MNKICYDSSKFVNAEIEFSGADNETRIVLTRIRGKAKVAGAALDFVRFDLKVVYWAQYGRYFQVKNQPFSCGTQWLSWWSVRLGIKGLLVRD